MALNSSSPSETGARQNAAVEAVPTEFSLQVGDDFLDFAELNGDVSPAPDDEKGEGF